MMNIEGREKVFDAAVALWKQTGIEYGEAAIAHTYESIGMQKALAMLEGKEYFEIQREFSEILNK